MTGSFGTQMLTSHPFNRIRLATHLYAEQLLDRDHYMEWLVSGLENSTQAKLPMWMLITQIYWKDLLAMRKSGRRLVTALLSHLHVVSRVGILQPTYPEFVVTNLLPTHRFKTTPIRTYLASYLPGLHHYFPPSWQLAPRTLYPRPPGSNITIHYLLVCRQTTNNTKTFLKRSPTETSSS